MSEVTQKYEGVMPIEILAEGEVVLRVLRPEDAGALFRILESDPNISDRVTWMHGVKNEQDIINGISEFQKKRRLRYAILVEGNVAGYVGMWRDEGYMDPHAPEDTYGFGYFLDPQYRGRGITYEAASALMHKAENVFTIKRWRAYVEDDNKASQAVLSKLDLHPTDSVFEEPVMHTQERCWEKIR